MGKVEIFKIMLGVEEICQVQEENPNKAVEIGVVGLGPLLYAETTCAFSYVDARCTQHYCWCTQHFNGKDKNNPGIF